MIGRSSGGGRRGVGLVVPAAAAELAAVHDQGLRADEPGVVARQEQHGHRLVARRSGMLERDPRQVPTHQLALARVPASSTSASGVIVSPGATTFARIPRWPNSCAYAFVSATSAALDAL